MFELRKELQGARKGTIEHKNVQKDTPAYFMISNFGGGGTNVSRIITYLDLFENTNVPVLFNYYYLNASIPKKIGFDMDWLKRIGEYDDIVEFFKAVRDDFAITKKRIKRGYPFEATTWKPLTMLDSGSGNILRDLVASKPISDNSYLEIYQKIVEDYHGFAKSCSFNIVVAMDFAEKQTFKDGEVTNELYQRMSSQFHLDLSKNLELLRLTLDYLESANYNLIVYAPLHGNDEKEYGEYLENILNLEEEKGVRFDGFAIGGALSENKKLWNVPSSASRNLKSSIIYSSAVKKVRTLLSDRDDNRPLHVLGGGSINSLPPLVAAGADSFDCHSPWRRASDGNEECAKHVHNANARSLLKKEGIEVAFSKFLIPLLNVKGEVIKENKENIWEYVILPEVANDIYCDCFVCQKYNLKEIKELYANWGEDNYLAKILIYRHAVCQHEHLCSRLMRDIDDSVSFTDLIAEMPDDKPKKELAHLLNFLKSE